ncbi:hypothetical protein [Actinocorallia populi]|uniref:hypothetical protein n=1 Tax=Actinocorallia populi TaxID=2079200 RepID=UPI001300765A|nr:hypothetical protein [Actinocorallia populi]
MLMSDFPEADRFRLLALGVFMDGTSGGGVRPGNAGLALFGPHEETWKKLLRRAVAAGWLILIERGGARRGPGGTTVRRASVYAASVPAGVYARRGEILSAPPFKKEASSGRPRGAAPELKEADGGFLLPFSKEASGTFLPGASKEASQAVEGSVERLEGSRQRLHHQSLPSSIPSSRPDEGGQQQVPGVAEEGVKEVRSLGEQIVALLSDYTGQPTDRSWAEKVCRQVLNGREVRNPLTYIAKAVSSEPGRYVPRSAPWDKPVPDAGPANPDGYERGAALARELLAAKRRKQA